MEKVKLKTNTLKKEIINIFKKFGLNNNHASISANALINAELVGAYGHGLSRLKMYCDRIKKKVINPKPKIKIKKIFPVLSIPNTEMINGAQAKGGTGLYSSIKGSKNPLANLFSPINNPSGTPMIIPKTSPKKTLRKESQICP